MLAYSFLYLTVNSEAKFRYLDFLKLQRQSYSALQWDYCVKATQVFFLMLWRKDDTQKTCGIFLDFLNTSVKQFSSRYNLAASLKTLSVQVQVYALLFDLRGSLSQWEIGVAEGGGKEEKEQTPAAAMHTCLVQALAAFSK
ncbi:UNVERIFIED_CONTAM: hypothetical protein K2H54_018196 [Gekko kuhli]